MLGTEKRDPTLGSAVSLLQLFRVRLSSNVPTSQHHGAPKHGDTRQRGQDIPAGSNRSPFHISVLPRRSRRGWPIPNPHRPKAADDDVTIDGVTVTNDVRGATFQP